MTFTTDKLYGRRGGAWAPAQSAEEALAELRPILHPDPVFVPDETQGSLFDLEASR